MQAKRNSRFSFFHFGSFLYISILLFCHTSFSQKEMPVKKYTEVDPRPFADNAGHWYGIADKGNMINALPDRPQYKPTDIISIADNILLF